ncbi:MAG: hypothetical protein K2X29_14725, partial [Candidatus Obscuribacterales bacterium]|nr:hypothetical protein [Candidatus Obscuribacterales bacterium]
KAMTTQLEKPTPTKVEHADKTLGVVTKVITIVGAAGTVLVWLTANFYTGEVKLKPDHEVSAITTRVYDKKGQEGLYHTASFYLMPGTYHLEITPEGGTKQDADVEVAFTKSIEIPVTAPASEAAETTDKPGKKHWWQFWRS